MLLSASRPIVGWVLFLRRRSHVLLRVNKPRDGVRIVASPEQKALRER